MTTRNELYQLIDELHDTQLDNAKLAMTRIIQGNTSINVPVCDLGSSEDIATLYETVVYDDKKEVVNHHSNKTFPQAPTRILK